VEIDEKPFHSDNAFHLAGVIPIAGRPLEYNMDWHDCLMPLAPNYTMIEASVYECAMAGCETIWVVCNDDVAPLVRYRVGDYVEDPIWASRQHAKKPRLERLQIPIFYVHFIFNFGYNFSM